MSDLESRRAAVAFWTLLGAVAVTTLATATGNLAPGVLSPDARDALGFIALGLAFAAHALPLVAGLIRISRPVPLQLASGGA
ncbi:MAG: hypothetical protein JWO51_1309 [Rhodospirillales bacterium]|jgi:uncharacterized membrane protein|nr:hypothetical protein [Rhodospirillales bacterium]